MPEAVFDVHLEFDPFALAKKRDATRTVAEASHHAAEAECAKQGARLRHPDPREVVSRTAVDAVTGDEVLLVATRWVADL